MPISLKSGSLNLLQPSGPVQGLPYKQNLQRKYFSELELISVPIQEYITCEDIVKILMLSYAIKLSSTYQLILAVNKPCKHHNIQQLLHSLHLPHYLGYK
jgi:hypothetical protein